MTMFRDLQSMCLTAIGYRLKLPLRIQRGGIRLFYTHLHIARPLFLQHTGSRFRRD